MHIVEKARYMISDAAQIAGVESHVLRYWEDELGLEVPRNELGHRYYTRENIQQFQKIRELKEQGYQLKAIRMVLHGEDPGMPQPQPGLAITYGAESIPRMMRETGDGRMPVGQARPAQAGCAASLSAEERMDQFRELMSDIVGRAISQNNEELSQTIGLEVHERVLKEMDYLMREQEDAAEERYKKLDAAIRGTVHKKKSLFAKDKSKSGRKDKKGHGKLLEQPT
jgi:DNA-binding transcriptional MerR regulator